MPNLNEIGRLPDPGDNCAIAIRDLPAGTRVQQGDDHYALSHNVLEGHRFAVRLIGNGETLTSWGQRFGIATRDIAAGEYVINEGVQIELNRRQLDFELPATPNFDNHIAPFEFDESSFTPAQPLPVYDHSRFFKGYPRPGGRGVGTRNMIVVLGTSSLV
ncbi:MAG: SAF domain-containing protein, partial [Chloroflexi bacterium]|nr:SAF domain-containing protein [Chloroflexota bacterium]